MDRRNLEERETKVAAEVLDVVEVVDVVDVVMVVEVVKTTAMTSNTCILPHKITTNPRCCHNWPQSTNKDTAGSVELM